MNQVSEAIKTEKAPISERPTQVKDTLSAPNPQEVAALEAVKAGLYVAGIEHDDLDFIADMVLAKLEDAKVLRSDLASPGGNPDLDAVEALIQSLEAGARFGRHLNVYAPWPDGGRKQPRSLSKALAIGRAIAAIAGVEIEVLRFRLSPRQGAVHVDIGNTEISIFYEERPEEAAQS